MRSCKWRATVDGCCCPAISAQLNLLFTFLLAKYNVLIDFAATHAPASYHFSFAITPLTVLHTHARSHTISAYHNFFRTCNGNFNWSTALIFLFFIFIGVAGALEPCAMYELLPKIDQTQFFIPWIVKNEWVCFLFLADEIKVASILFD